MNEYYLLLAFLIMIKRQNISFHAKSVFLIYVFKEEPEIFLMGKMWACSPCFIYVKPVHFISRERELNMTQVGTLCEAEKHEDNTLYLGINYSER